MRCKIRDLKALLVETLKDVNYRIAHGKMWVPVLSQKKRDDWDGEILLYFPSDEDLEQLHVSLKDLRLKLARFNDDPHLDFTGAAYMHRTKQECETHERLVAQVGKTCVVINGDFGIFNVKFVEDPTLKQVIMPTSLWVEVDNPPPDWRPDDNLPEDYYAL